MTTAILERPVTTTIKPTFPAPSSAVHPKHRNVVKERVQARIHTSHDDLLALIKEQYQIQDEQTIFTFLRNHSQLIPIL